MKKILWDVLGCSIFVGTGTYFLLGAPRTFVDFINMGSKDFAILVIPPVVAILIYFMIDMRLTRREIR